MYFVYSVVFLLLSLVILAISILKEQIYLTLMAMILFNTGLIFFNLDKSDYVIYLLENVEKD